MEKQKGPGHKSAYLEGGPYRASGIEIYHDFSEFDTNWIDFPKVISVFHFFLQKTKKSPEAR